MSDRKLPGRLVVVAVASLFVSLGTLLGLVAALRLNSLWALLLAPLALPALVILAAVLVRFSRRGQSASAPVDSAP
jgi:hypothetical protein